MSNFTIQQEKSTIEKIKKLLQIPSNKTCCDCDQPGPTYVNITVGSFVCMSCSGVLRGLIPAHRVKSVSMSTFTDQEYQVLLTFGNAKVNRIWLARKPHDAESLQSSSTALIRKVYLRKKYEEKIWKIAEDQIQAISEDQTDLQSIPQQPATSPHSLSFSPNFKQIGAIARSRQNHTSLLDLNQDTNEIKNISKNQFSLSTDLSDFQSLSCRSEIKNKSSNHCVSLLDEFSEFQSSAELPSAEAQSPKSNRLGDIFSCIGNPKPASINTNLSTIASNSPDKYSVLSDLRNMEFKQTSMNSSNSTLDNFLQPNHRQNQPNTNNQSKDFPCPGYNPQGNNYTSSGGFNNPMNIYSNPQPDIFALSQGYNGLPQTNFGYGSVRTNVPPNNINDISKQRNQPFSSTNPFINAAPPQTPDFFDFSALQPPSSNSKKEPSNKFSFNQFL